MSSQVCFEYLQRWTFHSFSGQLVPENRHHSETVFSYVQTEFLVYQFVPIASCPVAGHHWEEAGSVFFTPSLQVFINIDKTP